MIDAVCESCGKTTQFEDSLKGNVEMCPECGDFLDVGDVDWDEADYAGEGDGEEHSTERTDDGP